jgi:Spy/CpxP family protein refolding chaperone
MKLLRLTPFIVAAVLFAACEKSPTQANSSLALLDSVDQVVLTFNATNGLPSEPFHGSGPGSKGDARGPGAPFPDSLKLTAAQETQIKALRDAFKTANAVDLAALDAIHAKASAAMKAGKSRDEVRAILETAKPILDRLKPKFDALETATQAALTAAQKAWITAHKPTGMPGHRP